MNSLEEGFDPKIKNQIKIRQNVYGAGYLSPRTIEQIYYLNANTSWCKLVSSVDIDNTLPGKYHIPEFIRNPKRVGDSSLAKKYVLFNGTADNGKIRENAYGISNEKVYGLKPMMGIISATITHKNRGSLRKAEVKIKAWDTEQFQIIEKLYLRLGFTILLEWGHSIYYNNQGILQTNTNNSLSDEFLEGKTNYIDFLTLVSSKKISAFGNYDAIFGRVANFSWSLDKDGSYNISIEIVSLGDIIESLTINGSLPNSITNEEKQTSGTIYEIISAHKYFGSIGAFIYEVFIRLGNSGLDFISLPSNDTSGGKLTKTYDPTKGIEIVNFIKEILLEDPNKYHLTHTITDTLKESYQWLKESLGFGNDITQTDILLTAVELVSNTDAFIARYFEEIILLNKTGLDIFKTEIFDKMESHNAPILSIKASLSNITFNNFTAGFQDAIKIKYEHITEEDKDKEYEYYIRLGTFLSFLETYVIPEVTINGEKYEKILKIDTDVDSNIMFYYPDLISYDPRICVINVELDFGINGSQDIYAYTPGGEIFVEKLNVSPNKADGTVSTQKLSFGKIMNTYVNMGFILQQLDSLKDDRWRVNMYSFLKGICSGINTAFAGYTNLDVAIDENKNTIKIYDKNPLPGILPKPLSTFNLYGYKIDEKGDSQNSFVKNFSLKTELSPNYAEMITVSAQANHAIVGEDSTALSNLNKLYVDRFKLDLQQPNSPPPPPTPTSLSDIIGFITMIDERTKFFKELAVNRGTPIINPSHISNQSNIESSFNNAVKNSSVSKYPKNQTYVAPGTGFLPVNLSLTIDGLSGIDISQQFLVDTEYLPSNYPDALKFLIKNISHEISNNKWFTKIESYMISKGEIIEYENVIGGNTSQYTNSPKRYEIKDNNVNPIINNNNGGAGGGGAGGGNNNNGTKINDQITIMQKGNTTNDWIIVFGGGGSQYGPDFLKPLIGERLFKTKNFVLVQFTADLSATERELKKKHPDAIIKTLIGYSRGGQRIWKYLGKYPNMYFIDPVPPNGKNTSSLNFSVGNSFMFYQPGSVRYTVDVAKVMGPSNFPISGAQKSPKGSSHDGPIVKEFFEIYGDRL